MVVVVAVAAAQVIKYYILSNIDFSIWVDENSVLYFGMSLYKNH